MLGFGRAGVVDELRAVRTRISRCALSSNGNHMQYTDAFRALEQLAEIPIPDENINFSLNSELGRLRDLSRYMLYNNSFVASHVHGLTRHVIGPRGLIMEIFPPSMSGKKSDVDMELKQIIESAWGDYSWRWCWAGRPQGYGGMAERDRTLLIHRVIDGESFLVFQNNPNSPYGISTRVITPGRCPSSIYYMPDMSEEMPIAFGKEFAGMSRRRVVSYFFRAWNLSDTFTGGNDAILMDDSKYRFEKIPANFVRHNFTAMDADQERGIPATAAAATPLMRLASYEESSLQAAVVNAVNFGFFEDVPQQQSFAMGHHPAVPIVEDERAADDNEELKSYGTPRPGQIHEAPAGKRVARFGGDYPHQAYPNFVKSHLVTAAAALGTSYAVLTGDYAEYNYSSLRQAMVIEKARHEVMQAQMVGGYKMEEFRRWLIMSNANGIFTKRGLPKKRLDSDYLMEIFGTVQWSGPAMEGVDPVKEANAYTLNRKAGISTLGDGLRHKSRSVVEQLRRVATEQQALKEYGIKLEEGGKTKPGHERGAGKAGGRE